MLIEIPHPCGDAEKGGPPSKLLVSDANSSSRRRPAFSCSHGRTTWKYMPTPSQLVDLSDRPPHRFRPKTVRKYLAGDGKPGIRARPDPDPFDRFVDYVVARLTEDLHLWARTLYDELENLGFPLSYQSLTLNIRSRDLRPVCETCRTARQRPNVVIPHASGDETQWDWLELPDPPQSWGWGKIAHPLVGSLAHSGKWRGYLVPSEDQPHLVAGLDRITRGLGGLTRVWRFDRMATVGDPVEGNGDSSFHISSVCSPREISSSGDGHWRVPSRPQCITANRYRGDRIAAGTSGPYNPRRSDAARNGRPEYRELVSLDRTSRYASRPQTVLSTHCR